MTDKSPLNASSGKALLPVAFLAAAVGAGWLWAEANGTRDQQLLIQAAGPDLNNIAPAAGGTTNAALLPNMASPAAPEVEDLPPLDAEPMIVSGGETKELPDFDPEVPRSADDVEMPAAAGSLDMTPLPIEADETDASTLSADVDMLPEEEMPHPSHDHVIKPAPLSVAEPEADSAAESENQNSAAHKPEKSPEECAKRKDKTRDAGKEMEEECAGSSREKVSEEKVE